MLFSVYSVVKILVALAPPIDSRAAAAYTFWRGGMVERYTRVS